MFFVGDGIVCESSWFQVDKNKKQKKHYSPTPVLQSKENVLHSHGSFYTSHTSRFQGCASRGQNVSCCHVGGKETQMFAFFFNQSQSTIVLQEGRETFYFFWQHGHRAAYG